MPLTPGSTFERYTIDALVGRGGMGEVYRATDNRLHRPVALKVLRTDDEAKAAVAEAGGVQRLLREARAAAALNHPNSVAIYELGEAEGTFYIAMEFVQGAPLRRYVTDANLALETKVSWLVDAARALWAAHKAGLVHRDVKPGNIMVSEEGIVKVLDFGLAKTTHVGKDPSGFTTQFGQVLGTPRYMAPEQLEGHPADASADQFSFGVTAYEVISGIYAGGPLAGSVTPLDEVTPGASPELARAVARMMRRPPNERFATMEEAAHALRASIPTLRMVPLPSAPPVAKGARRTASDHPTQLRAAEAPSTSREIPVHVDQVLARNATLPLAQPIKMAMGHAASPQEIMNRTHPLARPVTIPLPAQSSGKLPDAASGVYPSRAPADETTKTDPRHGKLLRDEPVPSSRRSPSPYMLVVIFVVVASLSGAIAAWLLRG